jgi:cation diffusion facilitator family transporter
MILPQGFVDPQEVAEKLRAARVSVIAAAGMVAAKLVAGVLTNSLAILSDAGHSSVDLIAAVVSYIAIRGAGKPPDREHPYGHAKFESMGALVELIFLSGLGILILVNAVSRLASGVQPVHLGLAGVLLVAAAFSVDLWRTIVLNVTARRTRSEALGASAIHFLADLLTTVVVIVGMVMTGLGFPKADSYAALIITLVIANLAIKLGRRVFSSLTDRAPSGIARDVEDIVRSVSHVIGVHDIRVRQAGSQYFAEMHVDLEPNLPLGEAHDVLDRVEEELQARYPGMHVVTHPEPFGTHVA